MQKDKKLVIAFLIIVFGICLCIPCKFILVKMGIRNMNMDNFSEYKEKDVNNVIDKINNKIKNIHNEITENKEEIEIDYIAESKNKEEYLSLLKQRRKLDIIKGFTTKGIHRDDFVIYINNKRLDIYGSQGQHRTAILSLKLSELNIIEDEIGEKPILLLDDFMSELDEKRRNHFLEKIEKTQVIITCTDKIDIENKNILIYNVKEGKVIRGGN